MSDFHLRPIAGPLTVWYGVCVRSLPWRQTRDPYCIWVSEVMLQQTRAEAVKGYYTRFLSALANVEALAGVREDALFKLWEGLGYYSRARNLKRAAMLLMERHDGKLPQDVKALMALPGIGPYTAGAVASIAFGIKAPAVDGNVLRVLSRVCASARDIADPRTRASAEKAALLMMGGAPPGQFNQALMELGATICLPNGAPLCNACPISAHCVAFEKGLTGALPIKTKKPPRRAEDWTVFVLRACGGFYIRKRPDTGLLAALYELPGIPGHLSEAEALAQLSEWGLRPCADIALYERKHSFTHVEWHMRVVALRVTGAPPPGFLLADKAIHALPAAFSKCMV